VHRTVGVKSRHVGARNTEADWQEPSSWAKGTRYGFVNIGIVYEFALFAYFSELVLRLGQNALC
jgi:hypothetical protein